MEELKRNRLHRTPLGVRPARSLVECEAWYLGVVAGLEIWKADVAHGSTIVGGAAAARLPDGGPFASEYSQALGSDGGLRWDAQGSRAHDPANAVFAGQRDFLDLKRAEVLQK